MKTWKVKKRVHFEEKAAEPTQDELYTHLEKHVRQSLWIYLVFFLSSWVEFCIGMNTAQVEFVTSSEISCLTADVLSRNNWTYFQMRNISYKNLRYNCEHVDNLSELMKHPFEDALNESDTGKRPTYTVCASQLRAKHFNDTYEFLGTCEGYIFKQRLKLMTILGEMLGPIPLGYVADLYGRKTSIAICLFLWTVSTCVNALVANYHLFQLLAIFNGIAKIGMRVWCHILFMELCHKSERGLMCLYLPVLESVGWIVGVFLKENCIYRRRELNFLVAFPLVMLYFYVWFVPESPRWYISYGKKKRAWLVLEKLGVNIDGVLFLPPVKYNKRKVAMDNAQHLTSYVKYKKALGLGSFLYFISVAVYDTETKYMTLEYLTISSHVGLVFLSNLTSHVYTVPVFLMLGRHLSIFYLFLMSILMVLISLHAHDEIDYLLNMLNLQCMCKIQRLVLLYISEMVPTSSRAACMGLVMFISNLFHLIHFIYQDVMLGSVIDNEHKVLLTYQLAGMAVLFTLPYKGSDELPDYKVYRE